MNSLTTRLVCFGAASTLTACNLAPSKGKPLPDTNYCATPATLQAICDRDAPLAARYPAVDAIIQNLRDTVPNPGTTLTSPDSFLLGCSYGVAIDGKPLFYGTNGLATPLRARRITDVAGVASVSKSMTSLTLHALFEEGRIPGDIQTTTVGDLLPGAPADMAALTIHQLLAHTSGLDGASYGGGYMTDASVADLFPELEQPGLHPRAMWYGLKDNNPVDPTVVDEPNGVGNYSNAAYRVLGAIIDAYTVGDLDGVGFLSDSSDVPSLTRAQLTGAMLGGYEAAVRQRVAGLDLPEDQRMLSACIDTDNRETWLGDDYAPNFSWIFQPQNPINSAANTAAVNNVPSGYAPGIDTEPNGRRGPSGGWMMTIGDLLRLGTGFSEGYLVSDDSFVSMSTPIAVASGNQFGRGLMLPGTLTLTSDPAGIAHPLYGHAGNLSTDGYAAMWQVADLGDRRIAAAIMCTEDVRPSRMSAALSQIMDQVYTDYMAPGAPKNTIDYDPSVAGCTPTPKDKPVMPTQKLEAQHGPELHQAYLAYYLANGRDLAKTEAAIRADVMALPTGYEMLTAWNKGDLETAAGLLLRAIASGQVDLYRWQRLDVKATTSTSTVTTSTSTATVTSTRK